MICFCDVAPAVTEIAINWLKTYVKDHHKLAKLGNGKICFRYYSGLSSQLIDLHCPRVTDRRSYQQSLCRPPSKSQQYAADTSDVFSQHVYQAIHTRNLLKSHQTLVHDQRPAIVAHVRSAKLYQLSFVDAQIASQNVAQNQCTGNNLTLLVAYPGFSEGGNRSPQWDLEQSPSHRRIFAI